MIKPAHPLFLVFATGLWMWAASCTHYEWGKKTSGDNGNDSDTQDASGTDDVALEEEVAYGERDSVEKEETCDSSAYSLPYTAPYEVSDAVKKKAENILDSMGLDDKVTQMTGTDYANGENTSDIFRQYDDAANGIRGFKFRDGPRGLNLVAELQQGHNGYSTAFPVSIARGATFDLDLEYRIGLAQGEETLASKHTMMLAPTVNLLRHPAWGRAQESYGEDPYLLGRMGTAYTVGVQEYIPACVKHFIANNVENGRASLNSILDEQTLREIYGRAYEMVIQDGGAACVMAAYNPVNGEKSTENAHILTEILRDDFGFEGFVMSDWWAMTNGDNASRLSGEYQAAAIAGVTAGMDMELPWELNYRFISSLVENGDLTEATVNESVRRILQQKLRFNVGDLTDSSYGLRDADVSWDAKTSTILDHDDHIELAEEAARKGAVLLKNEDGTLPIDLSAEDTIAVLGSTVEFTLSAVSAAGTVNYATDVITGDMGSSRVYADPALSVGPLAGIRELASDRGITVVTGDSAEDAKDADFIVVVAGLNAMDEGEEYTGAGDRSTFALDAKISGTPQNDLIAAAAALNKPMVVVLEGGSVIDMPWLDDVPAVLMAWYPGMVGGRAAAKLLFGEIVPSGRLPITWPASWDDEPEFNPGTSVEMGYFAGYRYFEDQEKTPLFPFGYGLSYSSFHHLNLEVPCKSAGPDTTVMVKVDVSNQGDVDADEVVFLFVSYPDSTDERKRVKQLKGFYRVSLAAGQTKQVTMPLRINDLRFYDMDSQSWVIESGDLEISVRSDADTVLSSPSGTLLKDRITIVSE